MAKQKMLTPEQEEEIRVKDFFGCILPGNIKFLSDYHICGNSYCCAWAIKSYPPTTEEQALFSQLSDKAGVTLHTYNQHFETMEQHNLEKVHDIDVYFVVYDESTKWIYDYSLMKN